MNIIALAPLILAFLSLCGVIGGFIALKAGYFQQAGAAQERTITAQTAHIESLEAQIVTLKTTLRHLNQVVITIQRLEEKRGTSIDINGEFVTLIDEGDKRERSLRIRIEPEPTKEENS